LCTSSVFHTWYMPPTPPPYQSSWFDNPNNIWWSVFSTPVLRHPS
jgi:hypothetical protein